MLQTTTYKETPNFFGVDYTKKGIATKVRINYTTFGAPMPGRQFNSNSYRYGFGSKEKDNEIKGEGNSYDFDARFNDTRLGKWLSVDPLSTKYPWQSPYASMDNNPIAKIDPTGMGTEDFVKDKAGNIKWDKDANSQATTKKGETYLGKDLTFTFNSYIDGKLWDGPNPPKGQAAGNKLTTTINLKATENEKGELTGINTSHFVDIGETPIGTPRNYYPGKGGNNNVFATSSIKNKDGNLAGFALIYEQHASVSPIEEFGINRCGYNIVDVTQRLTLTYSGNKLKIMTATGLFPSATLDVKSNNFLGGFRAMYYPQPSFESHSALKMSSFNQPEGYDIKYYPSTLYPR